MDSLTQLALGAAVGVAVMGRRTAVWKAALWGGVCGTLPDLDAFIDHGDPVSNMTLHRSDSHALFWLSLLAAPLGAAIAALHRERQHWARWVLAVWLALVTHPLLDLMTVYGTQLGRPFTSTPFAVGSIFIIDPLYTLPLLVGVGLALRRPNGPTGQRWNQAGLLLSTAYLGWSLLAQQHVARFVSAELARQGLAAQQVLVTPTPFNTLLWRVVVMTPDAYHEGFHGLLDPAGPLRLDRFDRGRALAPALADVPAAARMAWFTRGFYALSLRDSELLLADLRMGQEPTYTFRFALARQDAGQTVPLAPPEARGERPDVARAWAWLWRRALGQPIAPPR